MTFYGCQVKGCVWCFIFIIYNGRITLYQLENSPRRGKIVIISIQSNFQLSVKSDLTLNWFCLTSPCDWSRTLAPLCQPITCKTKTNHDLFTRVFLRLGKFACFQFDWLLKAFFPFWLAIVVPLVLVLHTQKTQKTLYNNKYIYLNHKRFTLCATVSVEKSCFQKSNLDNNNNCTIVFKTSITK